MPDGGFEVLAQSDDREAWLTMRKQLITASDVAAIMGRNPYKSALEVYTDKLGITDTEPTEAMEIGLRMEPVILDLYRDRTGRVAKPFQRLCRSKRWPWLGATCDAYTVDEQRREIVLELKNASEYLAEHWEESIPPYYTPQIQTQIGVMEAMAGSAGVIVGGNKFRWKDADRDDMMIADIAIETKAFHVRLVNLTPPEPDGSESAQRALRAMFPTNEPGTSMLLPQEAIDLDELILHAQAEKKRSEAREAEAKQAIQALMGVCEIGVLPGNRGAWKWATQERSGYTVQPSSSRVFRRLKRAP